MLLCDTCDAEYHCRCLGLYEVRTLFVLSICADLVDSDRVDTTCAGFVVKLIRLGWVTGAFMSD